MFVDESQQPTLVSRQSTEEAFEGRMSQELTLRTSGQWGAGIVWDEPVDLSGWTTMVVALRSSDSSFSTFDLSLLWGEGERTESAPLDPRRYGYANDGAWHVLRIPLADPEDLGFDPSIARAPLILSGDDGTPGDSLSIDNVYFTKD